MGELDVTCTVPHCSCAIDLIDASPFPFISDGQAVCACHPTTVALAIGVERFRCPIPAQRKGGSL